MKKLNQTFTLAAGLILIFCFPALGQTDFTKATGSADKIKAPLDFPLEGRKNDNGTGWSVNPEVLGKKPQRVALVTFYLEDPGTTKQKSVAGSVTATLWATDASTAQTHINGFYNAGIAALREAFRSNGMELLTPDEFLDTSDKKQFYQGFEVEHGSFKKEKSNSKVMSKAGTLEVSRTREPAGNTKVIWIANESPYLTTQGDLFKTTNEAKFFQSMGYDLATGLGVDAVCAVVIVTRKLDMYKSDYAVNHVNLHMWGPNPIQKAEEEDSGLKGAFYTRGQFYGGSRVTYAKPLIFQTTKKKQPVGPEYDGIANIFTAQVNAISEYWDKKLGK